MTTDQKTPVWVTITVQVGDEPKTFEAEAATASNPWDVAGGLLFGLDMDARRYVSHTSREYNEANR